MIERPPPLLNRPESAVTVHQGPIFSVWEWSQSVGDDEYRTYEQLSRRDTALILPVTREGDLLLVEETQPGMSARLHSIGGKVDDGEDPEHTARRELMEEAGVSVDELFLWHSWQPLSKLDWAVYVFWASGACNAGPTSLEPGEQISKRWVDADEFAAGNAPIGFSDAELTFLFGEARLSDAGQSRLRSSYEKCRAHE